VETLRIVNCFTTDAVRRAYAKTVLTTAGFDASLPTSLLERIVQDLYVDFGKVLGGALLGTSYEPSEAVLQAADGRRLVLEQAGGPSNAPSRPIVTEADWTRAFSAWRAVVVHVFPHRSDELKMYHRYIDRLFKTYRTPLIPIAADSVARLAYANARFRMDDEAALHWHVKSAELSHPTAAVGLSPAGPSSAQAAPSTRAAPETCLKWNLGRCSEGTPCPTGRVHGICTVCGLGHAAASNPSCRGPAERKLAALKGQRSAEGGTRPAKRAKAARDKATSSAP
jgi:hypothetical protein